MLANIFLALGLSFSQLSVWSLVSRRDWGYWPEPGAQATILADSSGARLRLKAFSGVAPREAPERVKQALARLAFLYNTEQAYPGMPSDKKSGTDLAPEFDSNGPTGQPTVWLYAAERLTYGVTDASQAAYRGALTFLYCPKTRRLFQLELLYPKGDFDRARAAEALRAFSCPQA